MGIAVFFKGEYGGDIGMLETGCGFGLPAKPGQTLRVTAEGFGQYLDGDLSIQLGVVGKVYFPHTAFAKLTYDPVMTYVSIGLHRFSCGISRAISTIRSSSDMLLRWMPD
jgi:hypothetical protein